MKPEPDELPGAADSRAGSDGDGERQPQALARLYRSRRRWRIATLGLSLLLVYSMVRGGGALLREQELARRTAELEAKLLSAQTLLERAGAALQRSHTTLRSVGEHLDEKPPASR